MKNVKTFDQLLNEKYGKKGSEKRDQFESIEKTVAQVICNNNIII